MAEWSKATVLKTVVSQGTQGSNPCFSAIFVFKISIRKGARVVERAPLLREWTFTGSVGSNPIPSAIYYTCDKLCK